MIRLRQSWRIFAMIAVLALMCSSVAIAAGIQLPKGSKAIVKFDPSTAVTSGRFEEGNRVPIYLVEPIVMGGLTLVEEGAMGTAVVTTAKGAGRGGSPGKLALTFESISPKGSYVPQEFDAVPIAGETGEIKGKGKKLLSYLFIFGLFIKGGQAEVPADTTFEVTIAENVRFVKKE
ncbi:hypothetical protein GF356_10245 [candidate division GN15 bacterium]|nr:hypothetical protein [candidate division GN15 bacterium]